MTRRKFAKLLSFAPFLGALPALANRDSKSGEPAPIPEVPALEKMNRRSVIDSIRKDIEKWSEGFLFGTADDETLEAFNNGLQAILNVYHYHGYLSKFKFTTQLKGNGHCYLDGQIFLQFRNCIEFVILDFAIG